MAESESMPVLEAESKAYVEHVEKVGGIDLTLPVAEIRSIVEAGGVEYRGDTVFRGKTEELSVAREGGAVPVSVLRPENATNSWGNVMIYFHGGGFVWGSRHTHMAFCELIAQTCDCVVVNVEYSLSPEVKSPVCYDEVKQVAEWCLANKVRLANNDKCLVGVAGDSAGGNLSTAVCHMVAGMDYQLLIFPWLDLTTESYKAKAMVKYSTGYVLTEAMLRWFIDHFFKTPEDSLNVLASPVLRKSFEGLPPCLMIIAECDPLADQGPEYKVKLDAAGIRTEMVTLEGVIHGYCGKPGVFPNTVRRTIESMKSFIATVAK